MRCALVDDDRAFNRELIKDLENRFPELMGRIETFLTEKAFRERLAGNGNWDFDFVILDVILPWADPSEEELPNPDTVEGGYFAAGIRCLADIRKRPDTNQMRVIIHSGMDESSVLAKLRHRGLTEENLDVVTKRSNPDELLDAVQRIVGRHSDAG